MATTKRVQHHDTDDPSTGAVAGTLAGAAPPWLLSHQPWSPPSQWDIKLWPTGREICDITLRAKKREYLVRQAALADYEPEYSE